MIRNTTFRRAVAATASVAALGLIAATGHAAESTSGSVDHENSAGHVADSAADGAQLLGPELLGLTPETVDALTEANPDLATTVSNSLRSGDPYIVDATLTDVADLVAEISADRNAVDTTQDGVIVPPPGPGNPPLPPIVALPHPPVVQPPPPIIDLPNPPIVVVPEPVIDGGQLPQLESSGAEREQVIAQITEDLDAG